MDYEFLEALESYTGINLMSDMDYYATDAGFESLLWEENDIDFDDAMEGANVDSIKDYRAMSAEVKAHKRSLREALDRNDYATAAREAEAISNAATALDAKLRDMPYSAGSAILVYIGTAALAAFISGMAGFVTAKAGKFSPGLKKALDKSEESIKSGAAMGYKDNRGKVYKGSEGIAQMRKDAVGVQTSGTAWMGAGAVGLVNCIKAIKLATKMQSGDPDVSNNDRNALIDALRKSAREIAKKYSQLAAQYRGMKSSSATECWLFT